MKNIIIAIVLTGLTACSTAPNAIVFDGSSAKSTQQDIIRLMARLNSHDKQELVMALRSIQRAQFDDPLAAMHHSDQYGQMDFGLIGQKIDGMDFEQVLELAHGHRD
ncbi:hypothetical protein ACRTDJ_09180 [Shewanella algae]|uniref:hypothetical protein n=1 Tax=Shewanella algae TaxID=38313 RepID=UPI0008DCD368|nr:hypothetical protein [Shewanella algae]OHY56800.1 hypothetical protein BEH76_03960 [Shewanella algae]